MILLIASITLCQAAHKRRSHKRGVQYEEFGTSNYQNPSQHDSWSPQQFDMDSSNEDDEGDDTQSFDPHTHQQQEHEQQQQYDELGAWDDEKLTKSPTKPEWNTPWPPENSGWSSLSGPIKSKTVIKKIPIPYDRPIQIDNPIYTPVEKHIPIEHPVPVVKWVEKRVPLYQDHPVIQPIVKEEHVPTPYDQKVRVILQKVYVHVPSPPVKQTIIIRKKLARRNSNNKRKHFYGWL